MDSQSEELFVSLFRESFEKCFGHPIVEPLTETDSKLFSCKIQEQTGLVIGPKSIKNYSFFVLNRDGEKKENPSVATLDTLARFLLEAPYTDEITRKDREAHFPYWHEFRTQKRQKPGQYRMKALGSIIPPWLIGFGAVLFVAVIVAILVYTSDSEGDFTEDFLAVSETSLADKGWIVVSRDSTWWRQRASTEGVLTLFTLIGDNWSVSTPEEPLKNLLARRISADCFVAEIHLSNFVPKMNWQQAGIILGEDAGFEGKVIRLSLSYNDFFGGYSKPAEILVQGVSSVAAGQQSKPEEFAHAVVFTVDHGDWTLVEPNLLTSALKIEKNGKEFKFLFTSGRSEAFAFKEVARGTFDIEPKYIGIYASQGISDSEIIPVKIESFALTETPCH
jgi:hypothetical protein